MNQAESLGSFASSKDSIVAGARFCKIPLKRYDCRMAGPYSLVACRYVV